MKHNRLAAWLWLSQIQYFVVQAIVAAVWATPFSLRNNTISDLGNTVCGPYGGRLVCSPLHDLMNISFILLGLTTFSGAILLISKVSGQKHRLGLSMLAAGGVGTILVGLFPENAVGPFHAIGASLPFLFGNIALLLIADWPGLPRWFSRLTTVAAILALLSLVAFLTGLTPVLHSGGFERLTAYPQTIWMIITAWFMLRRSR